MREPTGVWCCCPRCSSPPLGGVRAEPSEWVSEISNTAILDIGTAAATVIFGTHVNGTAVFVQLQNIPLGRPHVLQAPDGNQIAGTPPAFGKSWFFNVPLGRAGTWRAVDTTTGLVTSVFTTAREAAAGVSVLVDVPRGEDMVPQKEFYAGSVEAYRSSGQSWSDCDPSTGQPSGYDPLVPYKTRVHGSWLVGWDEYREALVTIAASTDIDTTPAEDYGSVATTRRIVYSGSGFQYQSGSIETHVYWHAIEYYTTVLSIDQRKPNGAFDTGCPAERYDVYPTT